MRITGFLIGLALACIGCRSRVPATNADSQTMDGPDFPFSGFTSSSTFGFYPTNAFHVFAGLPGKSPIPKGVEDLQAAGAAWMDMHILCRFRAPDPVIDSVLTNGYQRTSWSEVMSSMHSESYTEHFSPKWDPDGISVKECYLKREESADSTDIFSLVVDRHAGVVYAVGEGSVH